ncbi:SDR family NAD(P)-dependent oxidoreductase [Levilactobacillus cerevisiae]|uniref:SDR family NAD(P)-dependent oxidoreductase n=1 Tax=Levilactobacillus cerevisiae TaxID=1704076 RepID=UPI000F7A7DB4|nr:SDR family oxidoreductase [Levilactobacillus cerevisiae]
MTKQVALVTGGTSGIGLATAQKFVQEGYEVVAASVDSADKVAAAKHQIGPAHFSVVTCNVADPAAVQQTVTAVVEEYGRIDVLANVAGILAKEVDLTDADLADVERTIQINLLGSIYVAKAVAVVMKAQGSGTIINVGSIDGVMANHESIAYHASKGGIHMFTKALARELSPFGIRVVCVAPGWVDTGMVPDKARAYGSKLLMKGRLITTAELAGAIWLMTLPEAAAINGSVVMADDGYAEFKGLGILDL